MPDEQKQQRDKDLCACYKAGQSLAECGRQFGLKKQRTLQILKKAGVWKPHARSSRTKFLGVSINAETKTALKERAEQDGVSVSKLASDALDALVKEPE